MQYDKMGEGLGWPKGPSQMLRTVCMPLVEVPYVLELLVESSDWCREIWRSSRGPKHVNFWFVLLKFQAYIREQAMMAPAQITRCVKDPHMVKGTIWVVHSLTATVNIWCTKVPFWQWLCPWPIFMKEKNTFALKAPIFLEPSCVVLLALLGFGLLSKPSNVKQKIYC